MLYGLSTTLQGLTGQQPAPPTVLLTHLFDFSSGFGQPRKNSLLDFHPPVLFEKLMKLHIHLLLLTVQQISQAEEGE